MVKDAVRLVASARRRIEVDLDFLDLGGRARYPGESSTADEPGADA